MVRSLKDAGRRNSRVILNHECEGEWRLDCDSLGDRQVWLWSTLWCLKFNFLTFDSKLLTRPLSEGASWAKMNRVNLKCFSIRNQRKFAQQKKSRHVLLWLNSQLNQRQKTKTGFKYDQFPLFKIVLRWDLSACLWSGHFLFFVNLEEQSQNIQETQNYTGHTLSE